MTTEPPGFELLDEIGRGGMGVVYRAHDLALDREVAVKVLQDRFPADGPATQRFLVEARITGQLQHPGIPAVHHVGRLPDGRPFLAMKLIKGRTLEEILRARPDPATDRAPLLGVFAAVCQAVGYAHAHRVIHRDLKPANVMVGAFGEVQVMDWGLAKVLGTPPTLSAPMTAGEETQGWTEISTAPESEEHTQAGSLVGTPAYIPPEQAAGELDKVDERADVFGLGALLAVILTGEPPYVGNTATAVRVMAMRGQRDDCWSRLDGCAAEAELVRLCKRCLAFEPAERPRDAGVLAAELTEYLNSVEARLRQAELASVEARAREGEERKRRELTVAAQRTLQQALTRQVAERLEGELGRLEMIGRSLAALVALRDDWEEAQLVRWMDAMLRREERIFGLFVAFEPRRFHSDLENYGLYQFRGGSRGEIRTKHLLPPGYPYRDLDWYKQARAAGEARWTEPFLDAGGGDIPMVSYTVPFNKNDGFAGVVNVDLSVRYFERLGDWLKDLDFGQRSSAFVISRAGLVISHPLPEYDFAALAATDTPPRNITDLSTDEHSRALIRRVLRDETGSGTIVDPSTGRPATWLFERVRVAGWAVVAAVEETETLELTEAQTPMPGSTTPTPAPDPADV